MTKVAVLVVLYKKKLEESSTLDFLQDQTYKNFKLIIWDNSPKPIFLDEIEEFDARFPGFTYKSSPENIGLSCIYNNILSQCEGRFDILIVFDQDSSFGKNYIQNVVDAYEKNNKVAVYIPMVYSGLIYHSPKPDLPVLRRFWTASGGRMYTANFRLNSINSGNALNIESLKNINFKFNEELRFYGVDNFLFRYIYKNHGCIFVMNQKLTQSLATREISDNYELYMRYRDVIEAYKRVYFPSRFNIWKLFAILHILKMFMAKRDKQFLKLFGLL